MITNDGLNKGNFFDEIKDAYPEPMKIFGEWIDEYKKEVKWDVLFGNTFPTDQKIKFHDLPYDMQAGIWMRFANETLDKYFEQPEYVYSGDLREDIKMVFKEIDFIDE